MARAVRAAADERTPLVASAETKRTARRATTATLTAMGALAVGAMATRSEWSPAATRPSTASDALGMRAEEAFSGETAPTRTFTVDASCPSAKVRRKGGGFWSEPLTITKARVVYHNYNGADFFSSGRGVAMSPVAGNPRRFTATTNKVNYEYGFELTNSRGQVVRDIGMPGSTTTAYMSDCTAHFGYRNRLVTWPTSAVFGSCESECPPAGEEEGEPTPSQPTPSQPQSPTCEKETLTYSLGAGEETPFVYTAPEAATFEWAHREMRLEISSFQTRRTASVGNISIRTGTGENEQEVFASAFDSPTEWNYTYSGCDVNRAFDGLYTKSTNAAEMTAVSRDTFTTVAGQSFTLSFDLDLTLDSAQSRARIVPHRERSVTSERGFHRDTLRFVERRRGAQQGGDDSSRLEGRRAKLHQQTPGGRRPRHREFRYAKNSPTSVASTNVKRISITYANDATATCAT